MMPTSTSSLPRGLRLNNPGNIKKSANPWVGKIAGTDPVFETFATPQDGINAIASLMMTYYRKYGLNTVRGLITRWSATDQAVYVSNIATLLGVGPDEVIRPNDQPTLIVIIWGIIMQENGQSPFPLTMLARAAKRAIGG